MNKGSSRSFQLFDDKVTKVMNGVAVSKSGDGDDVSVGAPEDDENGIEVNKLMGCPAKGCQRNQCVEAAFIQARASNELLTREARNTAVMHDIARNNPSCLSPPNKPSDTYNLCSRQNRIKFIVQGKRVCVACYAEFYCVTKNILRELRERVVAGDDKYVDKRKNNGSNKFHSKEGMLVAREGVNEYLKLLEKRHAIRPPKSVLEAGLPFPARAIIPLSFTNAALMADYRQFCDERGFEAVSLSVLKEHWKKDHPGLSMEVRVRKHPYRIRSPRKSKKEKDEKVSTGEGQPQQQPPIAAKAPQRKPFSFSVTN